MKTFTILLLLAVVSLGCNQLSAEPTPQQCMAWKSSANDTARLLHSMEPPHPQKIGEAARRSVEEKAGARAIQQCIDLGYW